MPDAMSVDRARAGRYTMLAIVTGIVLVVLYVIWQLLAASEEPTIRIKGGSVILELDDARWIEAGPPKWSHDGDESEREKYQASLRTGAGKQCDPIPNPVVQVMVRSSEQRQIMLNFHSKRSLVTPTGTTLIRRSDRRLELEGGSGQFVASVRLQGEGAGQPWTCDFQAGEFVELTLCDKDKPCN